MKKRLIITVLAMAVQVGLFALSMISPKMGYFWLGAQLAYFAGLFWVVAFSPKPEEKVEGAGIALGVGAVMLVDWGLQKIWPETFLSEYAWIAQTEGFWAMLFLSAAVLWFWGKKEQGLIIV